LIAVEHLELVLVLFFVLLNLEGEADGRNLRIPTVAVTLDVFEKRLLRFKFPEFPDANLFDFKFMRVEWGSTGLFDEILINSEDVIVDKSHFFFFWTVFAFAWFRTVDYFSVFIFAYFVNPEVD
jgi:hypothetical protein